jgi:DNA-binding transcriptional MerR regulator
MDRNPQNRADQMTLAELTDASDVSVRTVRYYISEGLLPPPEGAGPASAYSPGHLARLRLIQRLKEAYLPLKEIRRRLSGLEDDEVLAILARDEAGTADAFVLPPDAALSGARDYLALLETRAKYRTEPLGLPIPPAPANPRDTSLSMRAQRTPPVASESVGEERRLGHSDDAMLPGSHRADYLWRRIPLGDEAELVISDRVYDRHRDRIDWLVRWARKVFD